MLFRSGVLTVSGGGALCLFLNATVNSGATLALARAFEVRFGLLQSLVVYALTMAEA